MSNDFLQVNEGTKDILRRLASNPDCKQPFRIEFLAGNVSRLGVVDFHKGQVSISDNTIEDSLCYRFWFDQESAKAWQTFIVETSRTGQTYENTPLQLVEYWRLPSAASPVNDKKQPQKTPERKNPVSDIAPTRLEWRKPEEGLPSKEGQVYVVVKRNQKIPVFAALSSSSSGNYLFELDDSSLPEIFESEIICWALWHSVV